MDRDDLELLGRSLRHATESSTGADLDGALAELGWADALADDPRAAVATLFELQGRATATSSALDLVLLDALGLPTDGGTGVVLPAIDRWDPPATWDLGIDPDLDPEDPGFEREPDPTTVDGVATAGVHRCDRVVVAAREDDGGALLLVTAPTSALELTTIEGVDPDLGLVRVTGSIPADATGSGLTVDGWERAIARGRLALAHELVGVSRTMLALAREHALERVQFDRPIAGFQAVRHRLAETLVAIETADALLDAAWIDGSSTYAGMAKAQAGRSARLAMKHCQQVCAGIGFTTEHDLHRSIRRTLVLDALLGSAATITRDFGRSLLAAGALPPLVPL